uniref:Uncharacterized protein n=1 Tax=Chenopodium quinoa TaxID=63459 RepID=A0A803LYQ8_CHEQI
MKKQGNDGSSTSSGMGGTHGNRLARLVVALNEARNIQVLRPVAAFTGEYDRFDEGKENENVREVIPEGVTLTNQRGVV